MLGEFWQELLGSVGSLLNGLTQTRQQREYVFVDSNGMPPLGFGDDVPDPSKPAAPPMWVQAQAQLQTLQKADPNFLETTFLTQATKVYSAVLAAEGAMSADTVASVVTPENRYALDGKWDLGIGLWFESMVSHQSQPDLVRPDQRALDIGADYTFGVGNGLHVLGEFFQLEASHGIFGQGEGATLSAASVRYPVGLLDAVSGIVYLNSVRHDAYRFVSWQRSYDRWQFYVMGFWNPRQAAILQPGQTVAAGRSPLAGRGFQVMAVFNH